VIIKKREYPIEIQELRALLRRWKLDDSTKEKILIEIKKREAGYQGEKRLDYFLSLFVQHNWFILNNLRLKLGENAFEIDTVIITCYFLLLIDAKNYSGELFFDQKLQQCIRTYKDLADSILDPLSQAYQHTYQMKNFLKIHKLMTLPITSLVIITHPTTTISTNLGLEKELHQKAIHADNLLMRLEELFKAHPNRRLSEKQAGVIAHYLLKHHSPRERKTLDYYHIDAAKILKGVQCPSCAVRMIFKSAKWHCLKCQVTSKNAHEQAIYDYLLLFKSISSSECLHFLGLKSTYTTKRLLNSMGLIKIGTTSAQKYVLPDNYNENF
jgi:ribosomal protein S27AE